MGERGHSASSSCNPEFGAHRPMYCLRSVYRLILLRTFIIADINIYLFVFFIYFFFFIQLRFRFLPHNRRTSSEIVWVSILLLNMVFFLLLFLFFSPSSSISDIIILCYTNSSTISISNRYTNELFSYPLGNKLTPCMCIMTRNWYLLPIINHVSTIIIYCYRYCKHFIEYTADVTREHVFFHVPILLTKKPHVELINVRTAIISHFLVICILYVILLQVLGHTQRSLFHDYNTKCIYGL